MAAHLRRVSYPAKPAQHRDLHTHPTPTPTHPGPTLQNASDYSQAAQVLKFMKDPATGQQVVANLDDDSKMGIAATYKICNVSAAWDSASCPLYWPAELPAKGILGHTLTSMRCSAAYLLHMPLTFSWDHRSAGHPGPGGLD